MGAADMSGTPQLLLAARNKSSLGMGNPEGHLPPVTLSERKATQDLGVSGQKVKLNVLASIPSLPGPYPLGGSCVSRKKISN